MILPLLARMVVVGHGGSLHDQHAVCVPPISAFRNSWLIFMEDDMNVMTLDGTTMPYFLISYDQE
jgi:hypothetical protein